VVMPTTSFLPASFLEFYLRLDWLRGFQIRQFKVLVDRAPQEGWPSKVYSGRGPFTVRMGCLF
jgi:hypothetical protein